MRPAAAQAGDAVAAIDTPALVVDGDALMRNIERMAAHARRLGVRLRPHAKTHKCAAIVQLQMQAGAVGVCVQKVGEAQALADAGVNDLYISNVLVDAAKLARVAQLARRVRLSIAVDSLLGIERLSQALQAAGGMLEVHVEVDVGQGRCGVAPAAAGALAQQVVAHGLRFGGLQAYHGRAQHIRAADAREAAIRHAIALAQAARASVTAAGIACPCVTGGGTGSFMLEAASHAAGVYDEIQPGSYVFMDRDYAANEPAPHAPVFEHALFVKSQVISRGVAHAVVDAGHKAHAIDSGLPAVHGQPFEYGNGGDEHGLITAHAAPLPGGTKAAPLPVGIQAAPLPALGDTVWLVPGHCDPTVNLHEHLVVLRGGLDHGVVDAVWPVDARGRLD